MVGEADAQVMDSSSVAIQSHIVLLSSTGFTGLYPKKSFAGTRELVSNIDGFLFTVELTKQPQPSPSKLKTLE